MTDKRDQDFEHPPSDDPPEEPPIEDTQPPSQWLEEGDDQSPERQADEDV